VAILLEQIFLLMSLLFKPYGDMGCATVSLWYVMIKISVVFLPFAFINSTSCLEVGTETNLEKKKKIVRSLVQGELAENVAKAAVQATKSLDPDDCYLWALENEFDEEKVTRLQKEFDAEMGRLICFDNNCDSCLLTRRCHFYCPYRHSIFLNR